MNWVGTTVARRLKPSRATLYSVPCSMARLAVLRGSSTTWFQTSRYCRAKVEFNSINWVRHGSSMTFETGLRRSRISVLMKFPPLSDLLNKAVKGLEQRPWGVSYGIFSGSGLLDNILKLPQLGLDIRGLKLAVCEMFVSFVEVMMGWLPGGGDWLLSLTDSLDPRGC